MLSSSKSSEGDWKGGNTAKRPFAENNCTASEQGRKRETTDRRVKTYVGGLGNARNFTGSKRYEPKCEGQTMSISRELV